VWSMFSSFTAPTAISTAWRWWRRGRYWLYISLL